MSHLLTAAKKAVTERSTSNYEDLDDSHEPTNRKEEVFPDGGSSLGATQELEMNSVSVVPDGNFH